MKTKSISLGIIAAVFSVLGCNDSRAEELNLQYLRSEIFSSKQKTKIDEYVDILRSSSMSSNIEAQILLGDIFSDTSLEHLNGAVALSAYRRAADAGSAFAWYKIGNLYREGKLIRRDLREAVEAYQNAAKAGNTSGQRNLGLMLINGSGVDRDTAKGLELVENAAKNGDAWTLYTLADLYVRGGAIPENGSRALELFEKSANAGNVGAWSRIGDLYRDGNLVAADPAAAQIAYHKAIDGGFVGGQIGLAKMLIKGQGGPSDVSGGIGILTSLAETGDAGALYALGDLYSRGESVPIEGEKAITFLRKAAEAGSSAASTRIGDIYREGKIVKPNVSRALTAYGEASAAGNTGAMARLGSGHLYGKFGTRSDPDKAITFINQAINGGADYVIGDLANAYFFGLGVAQNKKRAMSLLVTAADTGNSFAARYLVKVNRDGLGTVVRKDPSEARLYLNKYKKIMTENQFAAESILVGAASATMEGNFSNIATDFVKLPSPDKQNFVVQVSKINPNFYVYLLQSRLISERMLTGKATGRLDASTLRALYRFCDTLGIGNVCRNGPMSDQTTAALAIHL